MKQTSTKVAKYGKVLLTRLNRNGGDVFQVSWLDPEGKHIRKTLPHRAEKTAKLEAQKLAEEMLAAQGFFVPQRYARNGTSVREALLETIQASDMNHKSLRDARYRINHFLDFLARHHPHAGNWANVTPAVVDEYVQFCRNEGAAYDSIRLRLAIIRSCGKRMARLHNLSDPTAGLRIKRERQPCGEDEDDCVLDAAQLRNLLGWLRQNASMLHVWGTLQGLAGLRMYEAAYLRLGDVDLDAGTVKITSSPAHRAKNRSSIRTLPVCPYVIEALRDWVQNNEVHSDGYLFWPKKTNYQVRTAKDPASKAGAYCTDYVSRFWMRTLAMEGVPDLPENFFARKLRATFATLCGERGADHFVLAAYMGHTPQTILGRHYQRIKMEGLKRIAEVAQGIIEVRS